MKNQIVIPTGYMGSGSSAVTDLLSEIQGYDINNDTFEYVLLHCPDGLFDLEDKLIRGNNALRSDEAIYRFLKCMKDLYSKRFYWVSGYKKCVSKDFYRYCLEFIDKITDVKIKGTYWYFQQNPSNPRMVVLNCIRSTLERVLYRKIKIQQPLRYKDMMMSYVSKEYFYGYSREFLSSIFSALGRDEHHLVLDQLLLPHNLFRLNDYFDTDTKVIVVDRDPRDVFILNKYIWTPHALAIPYPLDVNDFCSMYAKMRRAEKIIDDDRIIRIHFEDLVYNYDHSIDKIYSFLDIDPVLHKKRFKKFDPDISIKNTQFFNINSTFRFEAEIIEEDLGEYIYDFPVQKIVRKKKDVF